MITTVVVSHRMSTHGPIVRLNQDGKHRHHLFCREKSFIKYGLGILQTPEILCQESVHDGARVGAGERLRQRSFYRRRSAIEQPSVRMRLGLFHRNACGHGDSAGIEPEMNTGFRDGQSVRWQLFSNAMGYQ